MSMDLLIFDMDGVLIDVSRSYRATIRKTVQIYLETCLGFEKGKKIVRDEEVSLFKSAGGFNNDWDLTSGLLLYLLSASGIPPCGKPKKVTNTREIVSFLKEKSSGFKQNKTVLPRKEDLKKFLKKVKSLGGGLKAIRQTLGDSWEGWVYRTGELERENLVKRIFQEVYLGRKFLSHYHLKPLFYKGKGLYLEERLLFPKRILSSLHQKIRLGIASGRPRFEAELALKRFHLNSYFDSLVMLDECVKEEERIFLCTGKKKNLLKPHPYSLLRVVQEIGIPNPQCGYVGDVVDDMLAAKAAKKKMEILAIGFISSRVKREPSKESLLRAGADFVIDKPQQLLQLTMNHQR